MTPTNPPPQLAGFGGHWVVGIPYEQSTNKPVTAEDVQEIRKLIPRTKTIALLYMPQSIDVDLDGEVYARFNRGNKPASVSLRKEDGRWQITGLSSGAQDCYPPNPSLGDRINQLLPF